jgi:hypothetical protein
MHYDGKLHDKRTRLFLQNWSRENNSAAPQKKSPMSSPAKVARVAAAETKNQARKLYTFYHVHYLTAFRRVSSGTWYSTCKLFETEFSVSLPSAPGQRPLLQVLRPQLHIPNSRRAALPRAQSRSQVGRSGTAQDRLLQPDDGQVAAAPDRGGGGGGREGRDKLHSHRRGKSG